MKLYVASSWRNDRQPEVVAKLSRCGYDVYDFRQPVAGDNGFHWSEIDPDWQEWNLKTYLSALTNPIAERGFKKDFEAMESADACILVLPCGRSAHLELGWFVGRGKPTCILHDPRDMIEPELMPKMCDIQVDNMVDVLKWLSSVGEG